MGAGVFLASGLVHECSVYMVDAERGWEWWPVGFFMLQSAGLIGEKAFTGMSGRRVGGWAGRVWGYAWVLGTVQFVCELSRFGWEWRKVLKALDSRLVV